LLSTMKMWRKDAQTKQSLKLIAVKLKSHEALTVGTHMLAGICQHLAFPNGVHHIKSRFSRIRASVSH
jgi:hypothetical protein